MKKRVLIMGGAITVFFMIIVFVVLSLQAKTAKKTSQLPIPTPFPSLTPPPQKITVSGVTMNNILTNPIQTNDKGDALFVEEKKYQIVYFPKYNKFLISILQSPFEDVRREAERVFLKKLDISEDEACRLSVSIGTPFFVDPQRAGIKEPLSFCQK